MSRTFIFRHRSWAQLDNREWRKMLTRRESCHFRGGSCGGALRDAKPTRHYRWHISDVPGISSLLKQMEQIPDDPRDDGSQSHVEDCLSGFLVSYPSDQDRQLKPHCLFDS